jgi:hypothetical protein
VTSDEQGHVGPEGPDEPEKPAGDGGGADPARGEPDAAAELEAFKRAVHGLYEASLPDDDVGGPGGTGPPRRGGPPMGVAGAARSLGAQPGVDRVHKLHAVASALTRNPDLASSAEERSGLAEAIVPDKGGDGRTGEELAERLREFADRARARTGGLTPGLWREFVEMVGEPESADHPVSLVGKPGCNDEELVPTPSGHATTIRSRFWTHLPFDQASRFVDPRCWTTYGRPFWKRMALVDGTREDFATERSTGYTAVFEEVVDLPFMGEVRVHLWVRYERSDDHVSVDYQLAAPPYPNEQVTFDSGWVYVTSPTVGPSGEGTFVDGVKSIRFRDPAFNAMPDLACDGGWVHFMINMALGGNGLPGEEPEPDELDTVALPPGVTDPRAGRPPAGRASGLMVRPGRRRREGTRAGPGRPRPGPARPGDVLPTVGALLSDWTGVTAAALQEQAGTVARAVGRVASTRPDPRWVNDVVGMGQVAIDATEVTIATWRRILVELARMGEERRPGGDPAEPPAPAPELVGVWARALNQMWDMGASWIDMAGEQGWLEQQEQSSWSTTVFFKRNPERACRLAWSGLSDAHDRPLVDRDLVDVIPPQVEAGDGVAELVVRVRHPVRTPTHHYRLQIWDEADPSATRQRYCRGFGVPGAEG